MAFFLLGSACQDTSKEIQSTKNSWNWGINQDKEEEHWVHMTHNMIIGNYDNAQKHFKWIIKENPNLQSRIYEEGLILYQSLIDESDDLEIKHQLKKEKEKIRQLMKKHFP